ncbi:uncharacterized protein LOC128610487 [Ictalurus furcatus]|uniref:uncharacterized protein LOC128610487 n=1 Tax=Ictalurus furcatus TaxID=66913 RepID=UPI002350A423|nr:uncharacterized protein LOC128610487 [Ictalurus furcatus]
MKMVKKKRFWLILMGEEWTGKSSAGNTMLGQTVFKVDSDTEHVMQSFGVIDGRDVTVVDTPGWDSECSPDVPLKMLKKAHNSAVGQGFHILLLTIPISQNQEWNQKVAQRLSNVLTLFNDDTWKHTMILFTRADLLHHTGLEGYLKGSGQPFQSLLEKCEHRYHVLNNCKRNDHEQVRELMEKVEQMVQENNGQSLQLVMSEQEVGTLREHEMNSLRNNRQLVERCTKMEEHIGRESGFRLEDHMFKSLPPVENDPPMTHPTEQSELPEENSTCVVRSKNEMSHPGDMQDVALEYIHIQDEDTESTSDLCSESPAEIIRDLAMSSDDDGDTESINVDQTEKNTCTEVEETGIDRNPGDEEKNKKHLQHAPLQRNTPQTWDNQWDLSITCYIYSEESVLMTCVLQFSVCWRKMKPSCERDWISFTVCSDNIFWIYIMVLYLFVRYLCLIYETYGVSRETNKNQNMNTLVSGFVERQQKPSKENPGAFHSLLWQISNNRPKEVTQCSNMEDDEGIPQHSTGGKDEKMKKGEDEELPQHSQKGDDDEEEDDEEEQSQQIIKANDEIPHQGKRGDNKEIPQNDGNEDGENILQQRKRVDDDHVLQHSIKEDVKHVLQNNKTDYEETNQQSNADEEEELLKLKRTDDNICRNSNRHGRMKKMHRKTKMVEYENTPEHSQRGHKEEMLQHNSKADYEEIPQQSKRCKDEELSKHVIKDMEEICQNHRRGFKKEIPQYNTRGYEEEIPQSNRGGYEEEIPQSNRRGYEEEIPQSNRKASKKEIPQSNRRGYEEEIPQSKRKACKKEIPQSNRRGYEEEIPQSKRKACKKEIPQSNGRGYEEEIPQSNRRGYEEEIPQSNRKACKKEIPQSNRRGYEEEIPQSNRGGYEEEIPQCNWLTDDKEILQCNRNRDNEETAKHSRKTCNEEIQHHQRKGKNGDTYQQWKSAHDHEMRGLEDGKDIPEQCRKRGSYEIPQHRRKRIEKDIPQHTSVWDAEEIKQAPEQQVEGIVEIRGANKKIHHKWCRYQHTKDVNNFADAGEEDTRQQGGFRKRRRTKSLERFIVFYMLISLIPVQHAQGSPKAVVSIKPDTHLYRGERVIFRCDIQGRGYTKWTYSWYRNNNTLHFPVFDMLDYDRTMQDVSIWYVRDSDSGDYTCRGQSSDSQSSEISDAVTLTVSEIPEVVLSVSPQSWLTEGDSVTLNCEITNSSTDWKFSWDTAVPYRIKRDRHGDIIYGDSYTISPAALNHTGVYVCRAEREERVYHTRYSNEQPLWITGESPPVSLIINPNRTQHFTDDSLSLSCDDQSNSTGWRVSRYTQSRRGSDCSQWGSVTGSTCNISFLSTSYTGVHWCESESGENSNPVNITVHVPSGVEAPFSVLMLISSVVTASPYLLVTIILLVKCYRARAHTGEYRIQNAVIEESAKFIYKKRIRLM